MKQECLWFRKPSCLALQSEGKKSLVCGYVYIQKGGICQLIRAHTYTFTALTSKQLFRSLPVRRSECVLEIFFSESGPLMVGPYDLTMYFLRATLYGMCHLFHQYCILFLTRSWDWFCPYRANCVFLLRSQDHFC